MATKAQTVAQVQKAEYSIRHRQSSTALVQLDVVKEMISTLREPAPVEPPPPPGETPTYTFDQKSDWRLAWPSRAEAMLEGTYAGRRAIIMNAAEADGSPGGNSNPRCQLETPSLFADGEEFWTRGRFYLPSSHFPNPVSGWGVNIVEVYGETGDGSPPWQIQARGSSLESRNLGRNDGLMWSAPLNGFMDRWVEWTVGMKWGAAGWVEMHIDGKLAIPRQALPMGSFGGKARMIIQNYRAAKTYPMVSVVHENLVVIGKSFSSTS